MRLAMKIGVGLATATCVALLALSGHASIESMIVFVIQSVGLVYTITRGQSRLKVELNGRMTQLLEATRKLAFIEGAQSEKRRPKRK